MREGLGSDVTWQMLTKWRCTRVATKHWFQTCLASFVKRSSVRPRRIVLLLLLVSVAFFFTRIEPKRLKIVLAQAQFSWSTTLPTIVYGMGLRHARNGSQFPPFSSNGLKRSGSLGTRLALGIVTSAVQIISQNVSLGFKPFFFFTLLHHYIIHTEILS